MKKYLMPIREVDREVYNLIRNGKKKVETRGAGPKYEHIKRGDVLVFKCGKDRFQKTIIRRYKFRSITGMLKKYKVSEINPLLKTRKKLENLYYSFPGYRDRLKKYGLLAFELSG